MKIVIVCPSLRAATGNTSTVHRIQKHLHSAGIICLLQDMESMSEASGGCVVKFMNTFAAQNKINGIIILHAFKCANTVLCQCAENKCCELVIPFSFIFGGTDINVDSHNEERLAVMHRAILASTFAVAFTDDMRKRAKEISPSTQIFIQPQAVKVPNSFNVSYPCSTNTVEKPMLFILVTSIRPVKDPIFILDKFLELCAVCKDSCVKLLIIGPILDEAYSVTFFEHIDYLEKKYEFTLTSPASSMKSQYDKIHTWMQDSKSFPILYSAPLPNESYNTLICSHVFASINSSESEGMSSAVLESMAMGVPVIAREIPGNGAVITESETGLLFDTPEKFLEQAKRLLFEPRLRRDITKNAMDFVSIHHSLEREKQFYTDMCLQYFK